MGERFFSSQILKLKSKRVDAVLIFGSAADTVTFLRQMKESNCNVKYFHGDKGAWKTKVIPPWDKR